MAIMCLLAVIGDSPLVAGNVEVGAQRSPHVARVHAVLDGLRGGTTAETRQHVVYEQ